jgi:RNA recognition motif-containing protein
MEATQAAATTTDRLIFDNTKVTFGAGCEIKQVITALDSCRVLISNLPAKTTRGTLEDFLIRKGSNREAFSILVLRMSMDRDTQEASVIFNDIRDAKMVVEALDGNEYDDEILRLELTPALKPGQMDDFKYDRSFYLEVSLNAPSMRVQAMYPTVEDAIKKAKDLNGGKCWGRTLRVTVARQPRPDEKWTYIKNSIVIDNVDVNTPAAEIHKFANPFSVKTFGHRWFKVDAALHRLENHMRTIGGLKPGDFEVVKNSWKGTIFVRARFDVWEKADEVWQSLQETELEFLPRGHARSFLAFPHQYSLHVPVEHYDAQKEIYDRLEHQHGRNRTAHIVATRFRPLSLIQVVGVDKKAVGALKLKVEKIAQGQVVGVWDRFFLDWQGDAFFGRLLRQFGAYVRPDRTKQVLRVYGSDTAVNHARREIKEQMKTLAALDYQMTIEEHWIGFFIVKGMEILGDMLGEENVWLHTTSKPYFVSVRGGNDAEHALQKLVREASRAPLRPRVRDWSQTCSLCFAEPMQRFPLVCQHIYCTGCLKHMVISATDGNNVIRCIGDEGRCKIPVPLPVIERFIPPVRLTQIFENSFRVYLERHPNEYRFCQTPDCTQIYRVSKEDSAVIQCPACLIETCSHCHRPPHRGLTCEENTLIGSKNGQELLVERWAKGHSNVKKCPDCGIFIEKVDGCNHIHCRCGGHVCWICAKTFNDGIYDHLLTVHGGPYDADQ